MLTHNIRVILRTAQRVAVDSDWRYTPTDPYAVHVTFHATRPTTWMFGRDLLLAACRPQSSTANGWHGHGDVSVWRPVNTTGSPVLLRLNSPDGNAIFELPAEPLARFLADTLHLVAAGGEHDAYDPAAVDAEIASLVADA